MSPDKVFYRSLSLGKAGGSVTKREHNNLKSQERGGTGKENLRVRRRTGRSPRLSVLARKKKKEGIVLHSRNLESAAFRRLIKGPSPKEGRGRDARPRFVVVCMRKPP